MKRSTLSRTVPVILLQHADHWLTVLACWLMFPAVQPAVDPPDSSGERVWLR